MNRSTEVVCALALILWCVVCGNWHLEGKIAHDEQAYIDGVEISLSQGCAMAEHVRNLYAEKVREVFAYGTK